MINEKPLLSLLAKKLLDQYAIQQVTKESFYSLYEEIFFQFFEELIYFNHDALFNNYVVAENLIPYEFPVQPLFLVIYDKTRPIALFKGRPLSANAYSMDVSVVHIEYRRKGLYTAIMNAILHYTKLAGFSVVSSTHSPCNNDILLAKMKNGFNVTAMNISPEYGPLITLSYFHNPTYKNAFLFRCANVKVNKELIENSRGTLNTLNSFLNECK